MLRPLILRRLDSEERKLGQSLDYLRHVARVSLRAFLKFTKFLPMAAYRRVLPAEACYVARLVATRHEDCGTCLQIGVNLARQEGVDAGIIRAVVDGNVEALPENLADVYRFTDSVVREKTDDEKLREKVRRQYGEEGLIELALAISSSRVFPTTKRALGSATSCSRVAIDVPGPQAETAGG